jgi:hypothetical protein
MNRIQKPPYFWKMDQEPERLRARALPEIFTARKNSGEIKKCLEKMFRENV